MAPKKAGVAKQSQQKRDKLAAEAAQKEVEKVEDEERAINNGLLANAKGGADILKKLGLEDEI